MQHRRHPATLTLLLLFSALFSTVAANAAPSDATDERFAPGGVLEGFQAVPGGEDAYFSGTAVAPAAAVKNVTFTLVTSNDTPLYGVEVALEGGGGSFKATTGLNGVAIFPTVAAGTFKVSLVGLPPNQVPTNAPTTLTIAKSTNVTIETALIFPGRSHEWILFGDSNSTPLPPDIIGFDVFLNSDHRFANYVSFALNEVDYALGNTPIAGYPGANKGIDIVINGENAHPNAALAHIRYGINDIHRYLGNPTSANVTTFRNAYTQAVQTTLGHGIIPILWTLSKEKNTSYDAGYDAANKVIKDLAAAYHLPLVVSNINARSNPKLFISDGVHNSNAGNVYLLSLMDQTLMAWFTRGSFAP
ncbi:MAG: hypothetical protein U0610_15035 [bacterium]